jgi:hypothetical protein
LSMPIPVSAISPLIIIQQPTILPFLGRMIKI